MSDSPRNLAVILGRKFRGRGELTIESQTGFIYNDKVYSAVQFSYGATINLDTTAVAPLRHYVEQPTKCLSKTPKVDYRAYLYATDKTRL